MTSSGWYACDSTEARHSWMVRLSLYSGMTTETRASAMERTSFEDRDPEDGVREHHPVPQQHPYRVAAARPDQDHLHVPEQREQCARRGEQGGRAERGEMKHVGDERDPGGERQQLVQEVLVVAAQGRAVGGAGDAQLVAALAEDEQEADT